MVKQWLTIRVANGEVHCVPEDDLVQHTEEHCVCIPREEAVFRDDGSTNWLYIHHSLDGRENRE